MTLNLGDEASTNAGDDPSAGTAGRDPAWPARPLTNAIHTSEAIEASLMMKSVSQTRDLANRPGASIEVPRRAIPCRSGDC